jgi:hypothetical protein
MIIYKILPNYKYKAFSIENIVSSTDYHVRYAFLGVLSIIIYFFKIDWKKYFLHFKEYENDMFRPIFCIIVFSILIINVNFFTYSGFLFLFLLITFFIIFNINDTKQNPNQRWFFNDWFNNYKAISFSSIWVNFKINFSFDKLAKIINLAFDILEVLIHFIFVAMTKVILLFIYLLINKYLLSRIHNYLLQFVFFAIILFLSCSRYVFFDSLNNRFIVIYPDFLVDLYDYFKNRKPFDFSNFTTKQKIFYVLFNLIDFLFCGYLIYSALDLVTKIKQRNEFFESLKKQTKIIKEVPITLKI